MENDTMPCEMCDGYGRIHAMEGAYNCPECKGTGRVPRLTTFPPVASKYKLADCRCSKCHRRHTDIVLANKKPNKHKWIEQDCDSHLQAKIGPESFAVYLKWKQSILDALKNAPPPPLPVED